MKATHTCAQAAVVPKIPRPEAKIASLPKVIEFKSIKSRAKPQIALAEAFAQIRSRDYPARLRALGFTRFAEIALVQQGKKLWVAVRQETGS